MAENADKKENKAIEAIKNKEINDCYINIKKNKSGKVISVTVTKKREL